jgi:hypothetical protein
MREENNEKMKKRRNENEHRRQRTKGCPVVQITGAKIP